MVMHRMTGAENEIYAAMLQESPRVGLVRYAWMSRMDKADESGDAGCQHRHEPCGVAEAMIAAADAVSDCDWIIIDLQGSLGGTCAHASALGLRHALQSSRSRAPGQSPRHASLEVAAALSRGRPNSLHCSD
jgi:hypothetical protein